MKNVLLLVFTCFVVSTINGQQPSANPFPKTITVTGSAAMEIIPDEIYVNTVLKEYQKKGEDKKDLETIKSNFLASCKSVGIADSAVSIVSYTGYNNYYFLRKNKRKTPELFASITYQVKFSSSKQMDELVDKLDDEATQNFDIAYTSHSKMTEYRKQLKIQAVKAAKEKATYLTESIGEKLGTAVTVNEPDEAGNSLVSNNTNIVNSLNYYQKSEGSDKSIAVDFKRIKLRYEVNVVFALQ